jgi:hypothetical protein
MNQVTLLGLKLQQLGMQLQVEGSKPPTIEKNENFNIVRPQPVTVLDVLGWRDKEDFMRELQEIVNKCEGAEEEEE